MSFQMLNSEFSNFQVCHAVLRAFFCYVLFCWVNVCCASFHPNYKMTQTIDTPSHPYLTWLRFVVEVGMPKSIWPSGAVLPPS